jgi:hypothetical protein
VKAPDRARAGQGEGGEDAEICRGLQGRVGVPEHEPADGDDERRQEKGAGACRHRDGAERWARRLAFPGEPKPGAPKRFAGLELRPRHTSAQQHKGEHHDDARQSRVDEERPQVGANEMTEAQEAPHGLKAGIDEHGEAGRRRNWHEGWRAPMYRESRRRQDQER